MRTVSLARVIRAWSLHRHYQQLAVLSKQQNDLFSSHSVDEAERRHLKKIEPDT
jgi:hypothetical protein